MYGTPAAQIVLPVVSNYETIESTYTFDQWNPSITDVKGDATYTAHYVSSPRLYTITFIANNSVYESIELGYGSLISVPQVNPTKSSEPGKKYSFVGWNGLYPEMKVTGNTSFEALFSSTDAQYIIQFKVGNAVVDLKMYDYGKQITCPENPTMPPTEQYSYTFTGWVGYTEGMIVDNDYTFVASFSQQTRQYSIKFVVDESVVKEDLLEYGSQIQKPDNPVKQSTDVMDYKFMGWSNYYENMKVVGDTTFTAMFNVSVESIQSLIEESTSTKVVVIALPPGHAFNMTDNDVKAILNLMESDETYRFMLSSNTGKISFGKDSVNTFDWDNVTATVSDVSATLNEAQKAVVGERPVYDISLSNSQGEIHNFINDGQSGEIEVSVRYDLKDGESPDNLKVWYLSDSALLEEKSCRYYEEGGLGYVAFVTEHLSNYAIMYEEPEKGSNLSIMLVIIGGLGIVAIAGGAIIVKKRKA